MDDFDFVRGSANPFEDRGDPAAASKALKGRDRSRNPAHPSRARHEPNTCRQIAGISRSQMSRIKNVQISSISLDVLVNVLGHCPATTQEFTLLTLN
ncbi:MAG: hypothetical protein R3D02_03225 [Hyphomicrobiales bacterium]